MRRFGVRCWRLSEFSLQTEALERREFAAPALVCSAFSTSWPRGHDVYTRALAKAERLMWIGFTKGFLSIKVFLFEWAHMPGRESSWGLLWRTGKWSRRQGANTGLEREIEVFRDKSIDGAIYKSSPLVRRQSLLRQLSPYFLAALLSFSRPFSGTEHT